ncbi:HIT domain-containing protein [Arthrobacter jiangjiafuii]|uniref:HIT domain-containing protein n=1 Tax=Arthrobacter jiangjiafuii TaxID=2817475 RepID=A0A975R117_9MICC|nr:HIT domain-containing protein [Arthrobacter jiangjiafuii]MBP3043005.1 HIT domain-containing protein [Arthrobacter jiangjiafuii]QWC11525.1 HIT domain-containing protein [Arthrobacter jiangjiafuii]
MTESNLDLPEDNPCAFCDYLSGRRPFTILCRSTLVAVLVTRDQRGIGHLLVIPTRHYPTLLEATAEERHALIDTLAAAAAAIDDRYERPGIAIWQNNGTAAHQAIGHLHFHVAGTLPGGGTDFGEVPELSIAQTDQIARELSESHKLPICER